MVHLRGLLETPEARITVLKMYRLRFSCCILPFLNIFWNVTRSVFNDRICLCCKNTLTQVLPVPGLCLGDCISFTLLRLYPKSHSVSSDLGCETNFGMNLASDLLPCLIPFQINSDNHQIEMMKNLHCKMQQQ